MKVLPTLVLSLLLIATAIPSYSDEKSLVKVATMPETRFAFRKLAPQIHWFITDDLFFDRFRNSNVMGGFYKPDDLKVLSQVDFTHYPTGNLINLLKDRDARVRTLAMAALFSKEDPSVLPNVAALVNDQAETYPEPEILDNPIPSMPMHKRTVGSIAIFFVDTYLKEAGYTSSFAYTYGLNRHIGRGPGSFAEYWDKRKNRRYCASWFAVKVQRATSNYFPADKSRAPFIDAVRKQVDQIPNLDRDWILLWLCSQRLGIGEYPMKIASEPEVLASMKKLGSSRLLLMLQGKMPSDDPDLQLQENMECYGNLMLFVLESAKQVLRPDQADAILACSRGFNPVPVPKSYWLVAASQLDPNRAHELLHNQILHLPAYEDGREKAALAAALWKERGLREKTFLLDCFYEPSSSFNSTRGRSFFRPLWLEAISDHKQETQKLLQNLINDGRFSTLNDSDALFALIKITSRSLDKDEAATSDWREKIWHPLGVDSACRDLEKAKRQYPAETGHMLEMLRQCREFVSSRVNSGKKS